LVISNCDFDVDLISGKRRLWFWCKKSLSYRLLYVDIIVRPCQ